MRSVFFRLMFVFIIVISFAQPVIAAHPMALGNAEVVPHKVWEVWLSVNYREMEGKKVYKLPTVEAVYGLIPRLEWAIEATYILEDVDGDRDNGLDSCTTQIKYLVLEEKKFFPAMCAGLQYEVPTNEDKNELEFDDDVWAPSISVQKRFSELLLIAQVKYFIDDKWRYGADAMYSINKKLTLLSEVYAEAFDDSGKENELNFRLGAKYKLMESAKIFFAAGRSLIHNNENHPRFEANGGVMFEF